MNAGNDENDDAEHTLVPPDLSLAWHLVPSPDSDSDSSQPALYQVAGSGARLSGSILGSLWWCCCVVVVCCCDPRARRRG